MTKSLHLGILVVAVTACSRPPEVRSAASAALPVAVNLQVSAQALQHRFAAQRATLDSRNAELELQAGLARDQSYQLEQDWKFQGDTALPKVLALYRENDAQILADPLTPVSSTGSPSVSKPPAHDMSALGKLVSGLSDLRTGRRINDRELFAFFLSANEKLKEIEGEKDATSTPGAGQ